MVLVKVYFIDLSSESCFWIKGLLGPSISDIGERKGSNQNRFIRKCYSVDLL